MDWFLLSYHSISVFTVLIISIIIVMFLTLKRDKSESSWWLLGVFTGYVFMYVGYFIGYSVYSPAAGYHKYLTMIVTLGTACFVAFSYRYPKDDFLKESKIVIPFSFFISITSITYYVYETAFSEVEFNFTEHNYSIGSDTLLNSIILFLHIWCMVVLIRKTILYSEYEGILAERYPERTEIVVNKEKITTSANFILSLLKFIHPRGKDARSIKGFSKAIILLSTVALANLLNSTQIISNETYAFIFSALSLILSFYIIIIYLNSSSESTTFLVKLVGISLVTLLVVVGYVGHIILSMSENDYDSMRLAEIKSSKKNILAGNYEDISENIQYVLRKARNGREYAGYELLFSRDNIVSLSEIIETEKRDKEKQIKKLSHKFKRIYNSINKEELEILAKSEIEQKSFSLEKRSYRNAGIFYVHYDFAHSSYVYEIGFNYYQYRAYTHSNISKLFYAILLTTIAILTLFPKFFQESLVNPLDKLLLGVKSVNEGDLDVLVPVVSHDEIGFLADSFNSMVSSIKDMRKQMQLYAESLESKIIDRTRELQDKNETIQKMKNQQDGDYFLTSLLSRPLNHNSNKAVKVKTDFIVKQKNKFQFKNRYAELGGDICITGNIKLGKPNKPHSYVFAFNGDAMGKSIQGAGGALILGVVVNSILSRSNHIKSILDITPFQWMESFTEELNSVFKTFDGFLMASIAVALISEETGDVHYITIGHPGIILYRGKKASFLEHKKDALRLGADVPLADRIHFIQLKKDDILFLGSDGKDLIKLHDKNKQINDDENLILRLIEKALGDLKQLEREVIIKGEIADDFSILRLEFKGIVANENVIKEEIYFGDNKDDLIFTEEDDSTIGEHSVANQLYKEGKKLYNEGNILKAVEVLSRAFEKDDNNQKLNKLFGLVCFKGKQYETAVKVLNKYLSADIENSEMWYYMSLAQRKVGDFLKSIESAEKFYKSHPNNVQNLINLSDLYRIKGDLKIAKLYSEKAILLDPENKSARKILDSINNVA